MLRKIKLLHCWEESPNQKSTCLLPITHTGPHVFTPNEKIRVSLYKTYVKTYVGE